MRFFTAIALKKVSAMGSPGRDSRAFALGIARVQNIDGNIFLHRRKYGRRVQDLSPEVGQLRRFIEADLP